MKNQDFEIKSSAVKFTHYVSVRHFGPYEKVNDTWSRLIQFAFDTGLSGKDVTAFGICYDNPAWTPPDQIRYDACLAIPKGHFEAISERLDEDEDLDTGRPQCLGIRLCTMKPINTFMMAHQGDYSHIRSAYADLESAPVLRGAIAYSKEHPSIEIYRNNPLLTRPENLITEIHLQAP